MDFGLDSRRVAGLSVSSAGSAPPRHLSALITPLIRKIRIMASTPAVLVGMPVSTDEVRTDLAVVQGAVVQGTPLTRQLSQSAISEASVNGVAETEGERERRMAEFMAEWEKKVEEEIKAEDSITKLSGWLTALIVMPILVGEYPFFRGAILPIILLRNYRDNNWADAYCEKDIAEWALSPPYRLEPRTSQP
jgi:hypothetical protein